MEFPPDIAVDSALVNPHHPLQKAITANVLRINLRAPNMAAGRTFPACGESIELSMRLGATIRLNHLIRVFTSMFACVSICAVAEKRDVVTAMKMEGDTMLIRTGEWFLRSKE